MKQTNKTIYLCENCGNEFSSWSGRCNACGEWNTLKEVSTKQYSLPKNERREVALTKLSDIKIDKNYRISTKIGEFDRVLGGGIVPGSIILLGGEPGIGKSTLLLQVCKEIDDCVYVSAEESLSQIKIRADRLKIDSINIELISDGDLESIEAEFLKKKPSLLIVDSIQTVFLGSLPSTPGCLVQVRECGMFLQRLAKSTGIPIIIVGHVTKDGSLAGPRILEHLVDVVLYLEGERYHDARVLRGVKNRFGATNEAGIFSLGEGGMAEIKNPSELFLSEKQDEPGTVVASTLEGTRPILVEIQALVASTRFGFPKRTASGFDLNRLNLLAAVITKKTNINLANSDIYINIVGGLKLRDPAIDLAICLAIISSYKNKKVQGKLCFFGEIGLSGEIRRVARQKDREKEAENLGYKVLDDKKTLSDLLKELNI
jgi:DNA repair protein RadA/Sms